MRREVDEEILDIIPERLVDRFDTRMGGAGRRFRQGLTLLLGATAIAAAVAGWYIFMGNSPSPGLESDVPVIKADARAIKTRPENPGGMVVPNQDKLIYEGLGRGEPEAKVERLLPLPEQPKAPPVQPPPVRDEVVTAVPPPPAVAAPPVQPAAPAASVAAPPAAAPAPPPVAAATPKAAPPAVETLPSAAAVRQGQARGGFMIQIAAMGSTDAAEKEWVRLKKANPDLLGTLASDIVKVDLGTKGVFFRLRAGPMDELSARTLCGQMTKRNLGCMVVRK